MIKRCSKACVLERSLRWFSGRLIGVGQGGRGQASWEATKSPDERGQGSLPERLGEELRSTI